MVVSGRIRNQAAQGRMVPSSTLSSLELIQSRTDIQLDADSLGEITKDDIKIINM